MTAEGYLRKKHEDKEYKGKHTAKLYSVWRVVGPAGPQERFDIMGFDNAKKAVDGCWDYEVKDMQGRVVL